MDGRTVRGNWTPAKSKLFYDEISIANNMKVVRP